jgi:competence protein ComEC
MHIGQFSMVICGFVLAIVFFLLWPHEPSPYIAPTMLAATALIYAAALYIGSQSLRRVAYILLAIFFLAILLDRPAITMRNVLWAASLVLLWQPSAVLQAGFQMSFSAVMALVTVYEAWRQRDTLHLRWERLPLAQQLWRRIWRYGSALFLTSLIAGSVTGFIAIVRFQQVGTLIMPMAPLSLLLMSVGLEKPVLFPMQTGIESVVAIGTYFTAISGALWRPGASAAFTLSVAGLGFGVLCLVLNRWRFIGALPILIALFGVGQGARPALHMFGPDLIVARTAEAELFVLRQRGKQYELDRLARHHGLTQETLSCRPSCRLVLQDGVQLAYHDRSAGLTKSCREADVIIMPFAEARYPCRAQLFDSPSFKTRRHRQFAIKEGALTAQYMRRERLWERD